MKPVVDYVHSKNLSFGLYTCGGTFTCVGGRPGSKDHWKQDADVFAEWGVDWVKMDWCNTQGARRGRGTASYDPKVPTALTT
jgi:alpha-galactosidase